MRRTIPSLAAALVVAACGARVDRSGETVAAPAATPGLALELRGLALASGAAPVVTFRVTDGQGAPIDLAAEIRAGAIAPRFVLAHRPPGGALVADLVAEVTAKPYVDAAGLLRSPVATATQPIAEPRSASPWPVERLVAQGDGVYAYTFGAPLAEVDPAATHLAGAWATRTAGGQATPASATLDVVPAGVGPAPRETVTDAACGRCHAAVTAHDSRRGVRLCLACHTAQSSDPETGAALDLTTLVHKIHAGARLTRAYEVVGYRQARFDWSHVKLAPSHSTSFELSAKGAGAGAAPVHDPGIVRNCALCHDGAEAARHRTAPSRSACGSCHDGVDFATGAGHVVKGAAAPAGDAECARCHGDDPSLADAAEYAPVARVHSDLYETTRNLAFGEHRLEVTLDAVRDAVAGKVPQVDFTVRLDGAPLDVLEVPLGALGFQLAGPAGDYAEVIPSTAGVPGVSSALLTCNPTSATAFPCKANPARVGALDAAAGRFTFTFPAAIPEGRAGVWVVSYEATWKATQPGANGETVSKPFAANPVFFGAAANVVAVDVATGAAAPLPRRRAVSTERCNMCHVDLGFHSNRSRKGMDYCATCHNPNLDNAGRARFRASETAVLAMPAVASFPATEVFVAESVASRVYVHRIHMGAELPSVKAGGSVRYGAYGGVVEDFSSFEMPGGMRCGACHEGGGYALPEAAGLLPVKQSVLSCGTPDAQGWCTGRQPVTEGGFPGAIRTPPLKAICTSCHDDPATRAHADLNTVRPMASDAIETCAGCHGPGKDLDSLAVHRRD